MPKRWAPLQLIGDAVEASIFIRFARRQWDALFKEANGKPRWRSWAPRSGVRVRVQVNPHKITIWAEGGLTYYTWLDQSERVDASPTLWGYPLDSTNNQIRASADITKKAGSNSSVKIPYTDSTLFDPFKKYWWFNTLAYYPDNFFLHFSENDGTASQRLNQVDYGDARFYYTSDSGKSWAGPVPFGGIGVFPRYIGRANGVGRYLFFTGAGASSKIYYTTDDPEVLLLDTFTTNSSWTVRWLGGITIELLEYYQNYFVLASSAKRYVSHDQGQTWTGDVGYPGSYSASVEAPFLCTKLSDGTFLAAFPDGSGNMSTWLSSNGTSGWVKKATIPDFPVDGFPYYPDKAGILACENADAFIYYVRDKLATNPDLPYDPYLIWAVKDSGSTVTARPEVYQNKGNFTSWPGYPFYYPSDNDLNIIRSKAVGATTVDNAILVMAYVDGSTFDASFENGNIFYPDEQNPSADSYYMFSTNGGQDPWLIGPKIDGAYANLSQSVWQHGLSQKKFNTHILGGQWGG